MNKGFTLVELIAVVTIMALLVVITTPAYDSISTSVKTKNYNSKKESIKAQTLSFVEKYMKDKVYDGTNTNEYCFSVQFLIHNGIINSDDESEDFIKNDINGDIYSGSNYFVRVSYDNGTLKLKAETKDQGLYSDSECSKKCDETCN